MRQELINQSVAKFREIEKTGSGINHHEAAFLALAARFDEALRLLERVPKYMREDRAVTPGVTRLARLADEIDAFLAKVRT